MRYMTYKTAKSRAEFKKAVLERDDFTCLACGYYGDNRTLEADHITGRKSRLDDVRAAGATVCSYYGRCDFHRLKTDGRVKWRASQLPDECIEFIEKRKWPLWEGVIWNRE